MLKKRKHKIKRRNTEPSVNHPLALAAQPSQTSAPALAQCPTTWGTTPFRSIRSRQLTWPTFATRPHTPLQFNT